MASNRTHLFSRILRRLGLNSARAVGELVGHRLATQPSLLQWAERVSDEQVRRHFGPDEPPTDQTLYSVIRYFHAWRVHTLRQRIGSRLGAARVLDVGDTDGLILKHLEKTGIGFNLSPGAIANIEANGIEARLGDGHGLPFADAEFDIVLCFETLEHLENPHQVLLELARVCKPDGRVFVSIPWVPRTYIHPRDSRRPRGAMHLFEFCREDFGALLTHTPLQIVWENVCEMFGTPRTFSQCCLLLAHSRNHIVGGVFRRFQFFELALKP